MNLHHYRRKAIALACIAAISGTAFAQEQGPATQADPRHAADLEAVHVTGTRISNINVISPTPIMVLSSEDIKSSGAVTRI